MKQTQRKSLNGLYNNYRVVKRSKSQSSAAEVRWNEGLIIVNAARSSSELQTSPCYCDITIPPDTKVH